MRTDHPYEYEGELLKRYPRALLALINDEVALINDEVALTTAFRREAADRRHWDAIKRAVKK